jgi:hypothetical protein
LTNDKITIALFQTLSDSLEYKNIEQIRNIFQDNIPAKNSLSRTKNSDEINVNPLTTKQNKNYRHQITTIQWKMILCDNTSVINLINLFLQEKIYIYIKSLN